eukprot:4044168-Prymnesium_polylepis.1
MMKASNVGLRSPGVADTTPYFTHYRGHSDVLFVCSQSSFRAGRLDQGSQGSDCTGVEFCSVAIRHEKHEHEECDVRAHDDDGYC